MSGLIVFAFPSPFEKAKTTITPLPFLSRLLLCVDAFVALHLLSSVLSNDQTRECAAVKEDIVYSLCRAMIFDSSVSFPCECYHELYLQTVDGNERFTHARAREKSNSFLVSLFSAGTKMWSKFEAHESKTKEVPCALAENVILNILLQRYN